MADDKDKIVSIDGGGQNNPSSEAMRDMIKNIDLYVEFMGTIAKMQRAKYIALIKEGFNEEEAFELCKTTMM
jgi:AmiR/NasT family two-component response regulator